MAEENKGKIKRKGSGRKKGFRLDESKKKEPSVVIRIPKSLKQKVEDLKSKHRNESTPPNT